MGNAYSEHGQCMDMHGQCMGNARAVHILSMGNAYSEQGQCMGNALNIGCISLEALIFR